MAFAIYIKFHIDTAVSPFDPDSNFTMRALSLVEVAGIPMMHSIDIYTEEIRTTVSIRHMKSESQTDEPMWHLGERSSSRHFLQSRVGRLFADWLKGGGKLPPTWRSLLQVIRQLGLDDLANQVETYLKTGKSGRVKHHPIVGKEKTFIPVKSKRS